MAVTPKPDRLHRAHRAAPVASAALLVVALVTAIAAAVALPACSFEDAYREPAPNTHTAEDRPGPGMNAFDFLANNDHSVDETGLMTETQLRGYCTVRDSAVDDTYITHFGKVTLARSHALVCGSVITVRQDISQVQVALLAVTEVLIGELEIGEAWLYSPEPNFFDSFRGEHVFALSLWGARGNYAVVTNFPLVPGNRQAQILTLLDLVAIEEMEDPIARKETLKAHAYEGLKSNVAWVTNVWAFQLAQLAGSYPTAFSGDDLRKLRMYEIAYIQQRPGARETLLSLRRAVTSLLRGRYKREWLEIVAYSDKTERRRLAATRLRDFAISSYRFAWELEDRVAINTVRQREIDPEIARILWEADLYIREVLAEDESVTTSSSTG